MKRKLMKLLALGLAGAVLMGCSGKANTSEEVQPSTESTSEEATTDKEVPTVTMHQINLDGNYTQEGIDRVEEAVNKVLEERYGINFELVILTASDYATQLNLAMASDEADVVILLNGFSSIGTMVDNGQLVALDDYLANASDAMKATFDENELSGMVYDGKLYGVPRQYMSGLKTVLRMNEEMLNSLGVDPESIYTYEDMDALFAKVHEAYPDVQVLVPQITDTLTNALIFGDDMSAGNKIVYTRPAEPDQKEVEFLFDNEYFKEWCTWVHKWYEDGYIMSDVLSNTNTNGATLIQAGTAFAEIANADLYEPEPGLIDADILQEPRQQATAYVDVGYGISANSKNKDAAWTLLEVLYTDSELANMIAFGVEGEDYVIGNDGLACLPEGVDLATASYGGVATSSVWPNYAVMHETYRQFPGYIEAVAEWNKTCIPTAGTGFVWDSAGLTDQVTACKNVMDKYYKALLCGMVDPEEIIPRAKEELIAAGGEEILESIQTQFTERYWN